jgi:outer membrane protein OmpA-like peptidoglycan-associated protein
MRFRPLLLVILVLSLQAMGCAKKNLVVLIPDPDGSVGRITVSNKAGRVEIDTPYQATRLADKDTVPGTPFAMEKKEVTSTFSHALRIQPTPPVHFILYFETGSENLVPESRELLPTILDAVKERKSVSISVIGHADTAGNREYNLGLSRRRAQAITRILLEKGIDQDRIDTTSHGEENLLIKTEDNVVEPKNRRVEVIVR